jgi:hypothetical protein
LILSLKKAVDILEKADRLLSTMKNVTFKRVQNQSLSNLYIGTINGEIVGFIYKPTDTKSDRNAWRSYVGVGDSARFLYHTWDMNDAMEAVQLAVK